MLCCALLCVHSSFAIISMVKRELVALLCLSSWCFMFFVWLFFTMPWVCLQFVIVVFPDHTHLLFLLYKFENRMLITVEYDIASFISSVIAVFPDHILLLL